MVNLCECGFWNGTFFFTSEYCDGGSVAKLMKDRGAPLGAIESVELIVQVLAGLEYAHGAEVSAKLADGTLAQARGLTHRDLKPHNILLMRAGSTLVAKVADFGLSKAFDLAGLSGQTRTGTVAGTPYFMPRQQVVNFKHARPDVDVWAAAASLYFMLTRCFPRDFPEKADPWLTVLQTAPVLIRRRQPGIPSKLAELIDLALVDKPSIHFRTAAGFKNALEGVL